MPLHHLESGMIAFLTDESVLNAENSVLQPLTLCAADT